MLALLSFPSLLSPPFCADPLRATPPLSRYALAPPARIPHVPAALLCRCGAVSVAQRQPRRVGPPPPLPGCLCGTRPFSLGRQPRACRVSRGEAVHGRQPAGSLHPSCTCLWHPAHRNHRNSRNSRNSLCAVDAWRHRCCPCPRPSTFHGRSQQHSRRAGLWQQGRRARAAFTAALCCLSRLLLSVQTPCW